MTRNNRGCDAKDVVQSRDNGATVVFFALAEGAEEVSEIQTYAYRVPRFSLQLPLELCIAGETIPGYTRDLSDAGLLVQLTVPVISGTSGRLRLHMGTCTIEIGVQVAHTELLDAGLRFCFSSPVEEQFIRTLVKVIARGVNRPGLQAANMGVSMADLGFDAGPS